MNYISTILLSFLACTYLSLQPINSGVSSVSDAETELGSGIEIEYGPNLGTTFFDAHNQKRFYIHITTVITNRNNHSIVVQSQLSDRKNYPEICADDPYEIFLLPENLTPDTATVYNNVVNGQHEFLHHSLDSIYHFKKTLLPGEFCVLTYGVIHPPNAECSAVPRAIFTDKNLYKQCISEKNNIINSNMGMPFYLKLELFKQRKFISPGDSCIIIPVGNFETLKDSNN